MSKILVGDFKDLGKGEVGSKWASLVDVNPFHLVVFQIGI